MDIPSITLAYFSPTRTTRRIVEAVAEGLGAPQVQTIDLTPPEAAGRSLAVDPRGLTVIGSPVYAGRLPADMLARFRTIKGCGGPAVVLVAYGNRAYEDALLELRDLALAAGFLPIAAGAFIGEHSYSQASTPIAQGRPDRADLEQAAAFGERVREKLRGLSALDGLAPVQVPGNFPYKEASLASGIAPATDAALCSGCGECAAVCPVGAIPADEPARTLAERCIRCCACVKFCPSGAKTLSHALIDKFRAFMAANHLAPRQPETYL